jgi:hypothetical protein
LPLINKTGLSYQEEDEYRNLILNQSAPIYERLDKLSKLKKLAKESQESREIRAKKNNRTAVLLINGKSVSLVFFCSNSSVTALLSASFPCSLKSGNISSSLIYFFVNSRLFSSIFLNSFSRFSL